MTERKIEGKGAIWGWFMAALLAELTMASMLLYRDEWNAAGLRIVSTPTGLNALAVAALILLFSVIWLSLHHFDLAYQRYELTAKHTGAQPT